jgi:hypothetical protein
VSLTIAALETLTSVTGNTPMQQGAQLQAHQSEPDYSCTGDAHECDREHADATGRPTAGSSK